MSQKQTNWAKGELRRAVRATIDRTQVVSEIRAAKRRKDAAIVRRGVTKEGETFIVRRNYYE